MKNAILIEVTDKSFSQRIIEGHDIIIIASSEEVLPSDITIDETRTTTVAKLEETVLDTLDTLESENNRLGEPLNGLEFRDETLSVVSNLGK